MNRRTLVALAVGILLGTAGTTLLTPDPWYHCPEDAVWTWQGEYPADRAQYACVPLDDIAPEVTP